MITMIVASCPYPFVTEPLGLVEFCPLSIVIRTRFMKYPSWIGMVQMVEISTAVAPRFSL
jgi:hypothetical protein